MNPQGQSLGSRPRCCTTQAGGNWFVRLHAAEVARG
jgi:hypothetical protein